MRVLELARILAGPWAGQILADLGAEVIKVEGPDGDDTRRWGPPFVKNEDGSQDAAYFHATNRGKSSVVADFNDRSDLENVLDLAREADVLIENFKVGSLRKFGLDYASLSKVNPRLVYCSITGFGQDGPYADRPGYDFIVQGMSGMMDITGDPQGAPQKVGVAIADIITGLYAAIAIQAALPERDATGRGKHIDLALLDCMVSTLANQNLNYLTTGVPTNRLGNRHPNIAPYEAYEVCDGWLIVAVGNDRQFQRFCECVGLCHLVDDDRFSSNSARVENSVALSQSIRKAIKHYKRDDLLRVFEEADVPVGPINTIAQAFDDPQVRHRGMQITVERASDGFAVPGVRTPIRFVDDILKPGLASPLLGQGTGSWHCARTKRET